MSKKMHSFELETLAVIASLSRFRVYLLGLKLKIVTDCNALRTDRLSDLIKLFSEALSTKCHGKEESTWDDYLGDILLGINRSEAKEKKLYGSGYVETEI